MIENDTLARLFESFPKAIINRRLEFVADPNPRVNSYFCLHNCLNEMDVAAKLLEWLSREATCSLHYNRDANNQKVHTYHLNGINKFCGTDFSEDEMSVIYQHLGNCVNHIKTIKFIESGYDIDTL